jgi:2-oxoisovalerate dehydrogenase E1 component
VTKARIVLSASGNPLPENLHSDTLLHLYRQMVLIRHFEQTVQAMYRAGELPGFVHLYIGEEATAVGVMAHLRHDDWITSTHRGHGHALAKGVPAKAILAELAGKATGCCGGRGGSMHLYASNDGLFGTNGIVAAAIPAATGLGISAKTRGTDQVTVAFFGDGASNHGAFYEGVNFGGIQNAPVVYVCENNLYATATSIKISTRNINIASKAAAFGIPGIQVDGNDVVAVWQAAEEAIHRARTGGGPTLIESLTYRQVGHQEGDPVVGWSRTQEEWDAWMKKCPIVNYTQWLLKSGLVKEADLKAIDAEVEAEVQAAADYARTSPQPDPATAVDHIWAEPINPPVAYSEPTTLSTPTKTLTWLNAVRDGIAEEMRRDPNIIYFGEGTGERGGSFGHTKGLYDEFGADRMIDTPICELGFTAAGIGASATGCRTVSDLMMGDFLWEAGSQIVLQAGKLHYMSNGQVKVPLVVRAGMGAVKNTGPHHSGAYYPVWAHCPGLIVAVPSNPADAKGMFKTALRANGPVLFLEHKSLLSTKGPVPEGEYFVPFGQAKVLREGTDLTIVSCGLWLHRSMEAAEQLAKQGVSCEVIDLRTIIPLDVDTIVASVNKTGRLLVVDEAYSMCGIGAELAAVVMEQAFDSLDAPVGRLHIEPVSHPFAPALENAILVDVNKIIATAKSVIDGRPPIPRRAPNPKIFGSPAAASSSAAVSSNATPSAPAAAASQPASVAAPATAPAAASAASAAQPAQSSTPGVPLVMPNMDLIITEATVVAWLKKIGDAVKKGEAVMEIETDKAVSQVESPVDGVLVEVLVSEGTVVPLGQQLGTIRTA